MNKLKQILYTGVPTLVLLYFSFGYRMAPNDPNHVELTNRFAVRSGQYPLGTDNLGRCILSRILYGGKNTLSIILLGAVIVVTLGLVLGLLLGGSHGRKKAFLESLLNAITAIPPIAYLIIFIAVLGNGTATMLIAVVLTLMLRMVKLVKTRTEVEMDKAYVLCAITCGAGRLHILFAEILPNLLWDVLHYILLSGADMVIAIVSFSFIGLGMGDNIIDWGVMIAETHHYIIAHPDLTLYPVVAIVACTLSFNVLGRQIEREKVQT
ncbi:MAG: ABC transporter permease [Lachnospiraceae bacterium]